jgi:hypothetical protein
MQLTFTSTLFLTAALLLGTSVVQAAPQGALIKEPATGARTGSQGCPTWIKGQCHSRGYDLRGCYKLTHSWCASTSQCIQSWETCPTTPSNSSKNVKPKSNAASNNVSPSSAKAKGATQSQSDAIVPAPDNKASSVRKNYDLSRIKLAEAEIKLAIAYTDGVLSAVRTFRGKGITGTHLDQATRRAKEAQIAAGQAQSDYNQAVNSPKTFDTAMTKALKSSDRAYRIAAGAYNILLNGNTDFEHQVLDNLYENTLKGLYEELGKSEDMVKSNQAKLGA